MSRSSASYFPSLVEQPRDVRRLRLPRLLDRHRHAARSTGRRTATSWTAGSSRRRSPARRHGARRLPDARIEEGAIIEGPCFIDAGAVVKAGARIGPYSRHRAALPHRRRAPSSNGAILWPNTWVGQRSARRRDAIAGRHCHFGRNVDVGDDAMFGDKSVVTDFSREPDSAAESRDRADSAWQSLLGIFKAYDVRGLYPVGDQRRRGPPDRPGVRRLPRRAGASACRATCGCRRRRSRRRSSRARGRRAPTSSTTACAAPT